MSKGWVLCILKIHGVSVWEGKMDHTLCNVQINYNHIISKTAWHENEHKFCYVYVHTNKLVQTTTEAPTSIIYSNYSSPYPTSKLQSWTVIDIYLLLFQFLLFGSESHIFFMASIFFHLPLIFFFWSLPFQSHIFLLQLMKFYSKLLACNKDSL